MNSTDQWRALLIVVNLGLIGLIGFLCYETFKVGKVDPKTGIDLSVPSSERTDPIEPKDYAIKFETREDRPLRGFSAIWTALRPAPPPPPKPKTPVAQAKPKAVTDPGIVKQNYDLLNAAINNSDPKKSSCFLKGRSGQKVLVRVGEKIPKTQLTLVDLRRESQNKVLAWVEANGKREKIEMREIKQRR